MKLSREEALQIREWRCGDGKGFGGGTWRWVAARAAEKWPEKKLCHGNQLEGIDLCESSAKLLNENPNKPPWN